MERGQRCDLVGVVGHSWEGDFAVGLEKDAISVREQRVEERKNNVLAFSVAYAGTGGACTGVPVNVLGFIGKVRVCTLAEFRF